MAGEYEPSYFDISGLHNNYLDFREGKYWEEAYGVLGVGVLQLLEDYEWLPEYFKKDFQIQQHLQFCETWSNTLNHNMLVESASRELADKLQQSPDHGIDHFRRFEKWYKAGQGKDKALRTDTHYLYFSPSAFIAIRDHDLLEVYTGQKEGHDGGGALFALGQVLESQAASDEFVQLFTGRENEHFPQHDVEKLAWGAAFICRYHSKPESMPSTEDLLANGLLDPMTLLSDAETMREEANDKMKEGQRFYTSVEDFFPPYQSIHQTIENIRQGALVSPIFTEQEIEGLKKQARLFSASDKLDSTYPADLSAVRTFQTRPNRVFYSRMENELSFEAELNERIRRGAGHESPCDLDRLLFEITRTKTFEGVSGVVQRWYARGLQEKGKFLETSIGDLLKGNGNSFLQAYTRLENDMVEAILLKAGYDEEEIGPLKYERDLSGRRSKIKDLLQAKGYSVGAYDAVLDRIQREKYAIESIIQQKIDSLVSIALTEKEKNHISELVRNARIRQSQGLGWVPGPFALDKLPYTGYIHFTLIRMDTF